LGGKPPEELLDLLELGVHCRATAQFCRSLGSAVQEPLPVPNSIGFAKFAEADPVRKPLVFRDGEPGVINRGIRQAFSFAKVIEVAAFDAFIVCVAIGQPAFLPQDGI
jgi:hypothetical protein